MAAELNLSHESGLAVDQGETYRLVITYAIPPETEGGADVPVDITGCTGRMQVREKYGAPVLAEATTENGGLTLGGADGVISVLLTDVQTDAMGVKAGSSRPRERAVYDLELTFPSTDVKRVCQGYIDISPNITRAA